MTMKAYGMKRVEDWGDKFKPSLTKNRCRRSLKKRERFKEKMIQKAVYDISAIEFEVSYEDLEAAEKMFDQLKAGTFYEEQEKAAKELGLTIKYI